MLSNKMAEALTDQINKEYFSAYLYLAMAAEADRIGLPGFSNWFRVQYREELGHAERMFDYVLQRNGTPQLLAIEAPEVAEESPLSLFQKSLEHERLITKSIFELKDLAKAESDHATDVFLEWFVTEQVEEESSTQSIVDQLKLVDGNGNGLFLIDRELASRQIVDE